MLTLQNWHNVPGIERCMVNRKGEVASLCRGKTVILQQELHSSGLYSINITTKRKQQKFYVDKIVAITFLENPYNFKHVAHKDGNKNNSNLENLVCHHTRSYCKGNGKESQVTLNISFQKPEKSDRYTNKASLY